MVCDKGYLFSGAPDRCSTLNVTAAATGTRTNIGQLTVGFSVGADEFTVEDLRVRGGGLHPDYHGIEQAPHMWDIGYLDGKPYPLAGASVVMLPVSVLERFTREEMSGKVYFSYTE